MSDRDGVSGRLARFVERRGSLLAATVAALAALPGIGFPFLSDDWLMVESVGKGALPTSPYNYFRPLYMATFWLDRQIWGPSPVFFHLTNLLLIAATAALVVLVARRYSGDPLLAGIAGILFALHAYHVENAAWVAVRGDPLYSIPLLLAALGYDRWREGLGALPAGGLLRRAVSSARYPRASVCDERGTPRAARRGTACDGGATLARSPGAAAFLDRGPRAVRGDGALRSGPPGEGERGRFPARPARDRPARPGAPPLVPRAVDGAGPARGACGPPPVRGATPGARSGGPLPDSRGGPRVAEAPLWLLRRGHGSRRR